jgi:hypothetical protein
MGMEAEEFLAAVVAIHRYLREKENLVEIEETPKMWKLSGRMRD